MGQKKVNMDALTGLDRLVGKGFKYYLIGIACLLPVCIGIAKLLWQHFPYGMDIDAILCGAAYVRDSHSPYVENAHCPGLHPATFVYAPQVAQLFLPLVQSLGLQGSHLTYLIVLWIPACLFLTWYALFKPFPEVSSIFRLFGFAALLSMTFYSGNIGLIIHALILLSSLSYSRTKWPFVATVLAASLIKPNFLVYLIVLLLDDERPLTRLRNFGLAATIGVILLLLENITAGPLGNDWHHAILEIALKQQPGLSLFGFLNMLHIDTASSIALIIALVFMCLLLIGAIIISHWGGLSADERLLLGLGLSQVMNPRLNDYDLVILVPFGALLASLLIKQASRRIQTSVTWAYGILAGLCIANALFGIANFSRIKASLVLYYLLFVILVWLLASSNWKKFRDIGGAFKPKN